MHNVVPVFALSRHLLARALGKGAFVTVVGLLSLDDVLPQFRVCASSTDMLHYDILLHDF